MHQGTDIVGDMDEAYWAGIAALVAIFAAIFAGIEAVVAVRNRKDAQAAEKAAEAARDAAVKAQQDSASAAGRIAETLERQAAAAAVRPAPWQLDRLLRRGSAKAARITLMSEHRVADVSMEVENPPFRTRFDPNPVPSTMRPGDAVVLDYMRASGDPQTSILAIRWRWADSEEYTITRAPLP